MVGRKSHRETGGRECYEGGVEFSGRGPVLPRPCTLMLLPVFVIVFTSSSRRSLSAFENACG